MNLKIKVYEPDMTTVKKECTAKEAKVPFGAVRRLMNLVNVENMENKTDVLKIVTGSWNDLTAILAQIFPEMEEEDWDTVDTEELVTMVWTLLKSAVVRITRIPVDPKNGMRES